MEPDEPTGSAESDRERRDREQREGIARNLRDEVPVVQALRKAGFRVNSIQKLPAGYPGFEQAVPILMEWLPRVSNVDIKMAIVDKLAGKWAKAAGPLLVDEFRRARADRELPNSHVPLRWRIGNALEAINDKRLYDDILALVADGQYGINRQMLVLSLGRIGDERAVPVLVSLLKDETLRGHAIRSLGKLKAKQAKDVIEPCLNDPNSWIRKEASKALKRIGEAGERKA